MVQKLTVVKSPTRRGEAQAKCASVGIEHICDMVTAGESLSAIAAKLGVGIATLLDWCANDPERSARITEARRRSARLWDEKAEEVIRNAGEKFDLEKARELAHHYRWRAKAIAPREYGDRVSNEHTGVGGGPIAIAAIDFKHLTDDELENMNRLLAKTNGTSGV